MAETAVKLTHDDHRSTACAFTAASPEQRGSRVPSSSRPSTATCWRRRCCRHSRCRW